jgi:hypothetical protein
VYEVSQKVALHIVRYLYATHMSALSLPGIPV